ncbi:MAG: transcriptional regulator [Burkholderiales bacterium]|nr:MAG: transcriptional regulator [Burkholderiales bacterium]
MAEKFGIGELGPMGLGKIGVGPLNVGNVLDTVEFVKKAWSSFGMPSSFAPTVDLEELDRRIADLRTVEQWLTVNMNMLQGTIQALEIQRGTIATLHAFSGIGGVPAAAAGAPVQGTPATAAPATAAATGSQAKRSGRKPQVASAAARAAFEDPGLSPTAWWNMLQDQFNQVAVAALSGVGLPKAHAAGAGQPVAAAGVAPVTAKGPRAAAGSRARKPGKAARAAGRKAVGGASKV